MTKRGPLALLLRQWADSTRKTKVLTAAGVTIVLFAVIGAAVGGGPRAADTASGNTAAPDASSGPQATSAPGGASSTDDTAKISEWIRKTHHSTNEVQVAVQSVQAAAAILQNGSPPTPDDIASLSGIIKQARGFLDEAQNDLVQQIDSPLKSQREEAWYAASQLTDAMGKLRSYLDSQKPSDLSDFNDKFATGRTYWNEAVKALWARAAEPKPPTI